MTTIANTDMAAAWDGEEGDRWAANADRYERVGWRIWEQFVEAVPVAATSTARMATSGSQPWLRTVRLTATTSPISAVMR